MAAPATIDAFYDLIHRSGLVESRRLDEHRRALGEGGEMPAKVNHLALRLVKDGLLTHFQAEQFLRGRWKGFSLGNYRILERLGQGGMGLVYLAEHQVMRHRVAIKVLPPEQAELPTVVERFHREARAAAVLQHPNLVRAFDIGQEGGLHFLVLEYVDGVNLQELVSRHGPLAIERAANYVGQAALGLQYAYETAGLVHRDVKPANLLVDRCGTVKVLDMGLARFFHDKDDGLTQKLNDRTILGTADYLAPEQALDSSAADIRADLYSLGGTFFFLLTGEAPFHGGTMTQKLMRHQTTEARSVRQVRPEVPVELEALIARLLGKDPAARYQRPIDVAEALRSWLEMPMPEPSAEELPSLCRAAQGPTSSSALSAAALARTLRPSAQGQLLLTGISESLPPSSPSVTQVNGKRLRRSLLAGVTVILALTFGAGYGSHALLSGAPEAPAEGPHSALPAATSPVNVILREADGRGERPFPCVQAALDVARPGERVLVRGEVLRENVVIRRDGVILDGRRGDGGRIRWRTASTEPGRPLLEVRAAATVGVRGFEMDGEGRVEELIVTLGRCPGLALEDLDLRGYLRTGLAFRHLSEASGKPLRVDRLRLDD